MSKILDLKKTRKELVAKIAPLSEKETLTPEEEKTFGETKAQADAIAKQIERVEFVESERTILDRVDPVPSKPQPDPDPARKKTPLAKGGRKVIENPGFENVGELLYCAHLQPQDPRILALMEMGTGESGGIAIPDEINPTLQEVKPQEAIFRPRATVVPAGDAPDADFVLPSVNQGAGANLYGGVQVDWIGEGAPKPEAGAKIKESRWSPKEVAAKIIVTDKLLRNWRAASTFIERMLRGALLAAEDVAFLKGVGENRPRGVLASDATKKVHRQTAGKVTYAQLPEAMRKNVVVAALKKAGQPMVRDAKAAARRGKDPRRRGSMKQRKSGESEAIGHGADSIAVRAAPSSTRYEVVVAIGPDARHWYMKFLEFGTARQAPQRFLTPAFEINKEEAVRVVGEELWKSLSTTAARLAKQAASGSLSRTAAESLRS